MDNSKSNNNNKSEVSISYDCNIEEVTELHEIITYEDEIDDYCSEELKRILIELGDTIARGHHDDDLEVDDDHWLKVRGLINVAEGMIRSELEATGQFKYRADLLDISVADWVYEDKLGRLPFRPLPVK